MITVDATSTLNDLLKHLEETTRKLKNVARGFAYTISKTAIETTPLGDANAYFKLYQQREVRLGLEPKEGFARGSWQVNKTGQFSLQQLYTATSGNVALSLISADLQSYELGDTLYIGNKGYYIRFLEGGSSEQAPLGIMQPTTDNIMATYAVDLKRLYEEG